MGAFCSQLNHEANPLMLINQARKGLLIATLLCSMNRAQAFGYGGWASGFSLNIYIIDLIPSSKSVLLRSPLSVRTIFLAKISSASSTDMRL